MADLKIEKLDTGSYTKFISENSPSDPYSLPELIRAYRESFGVSVEMLGIVRSESRVATCALFTGKRLHQPVIKLMPIRAYDGLQFRNLDDSKSQKQEYDRLAIMQVLGDFLKREFGFYQMIFPPGILDVRSFQWAGATVIPQYTYIIDLQRFTPENYTKSLREVLRGSIDRGLVYGECKVGDLVGLNQLSYERHGRKPPVNPDVLKTLLEKLDSSGLLRTRCVRNQAGKIVAGLTSLVTKMGTYFYVSGTDASAEKGASHLLYDGILKEEKDSGKAFVDFCGANSPSINLFKSAFGPGLKVYFKVWRANSTLARLASYVKKF